MWSKLDSIFPSQLFRVSDVLDFRREVLLPRTVETLDYQTEKVCKMSVSVSYKVTTAIIVGK